MNREELVASLEQFIEVELRVADLYLLFSSIFPADRDFWWQLCVEENNHAALLRAGKDHFLDEGFIPEELLRVNTDEFKHTLGEVEGLIERFRRTAPAAEEALRTALMLEEQAGEAHYQQVMASGNISASTKLFQTLNQMDKDHAARIRKLMIDRGYLPQPPSA